MTRFALYTRVSTEDQAKEGFSLDAQLDRLRAYVRVQGGSVGGEYVDEGHSGRTTKRPAYQRMMAEADKWDTLLVLKMDRIHRNSRNFMAMMDGLRKAGKQFASATESLDTSNAMGSFVMDIIQRIAQLESDQIGERTGFGIEQKFKATDQSHGTPPFGMRRGADGLMEPDPVEAPILRWIARTFLRGVLQVNIARTLNAKGITMKRGGKFDGLDITALLRNPVIAGHRISNSHPKINTHKGAIPTKQFLEIQDILDRSSRYHRPEARKTIRGTRVAVLRKLLKDAEKKRQKKRRLRKGAKKK